MKRTILIHEWVTGSGSVGPDSPTSWAIEGAAMRRTLARDFASIPSIPTRVLVTLDRRQPDDPGPWEIVRVDDGGEEEMIRSWSSRADFVLIIAPETRGILQQLAGLVERLQIRSLGSTQEAVRMTGNKLLLAERLLEAGITTPQPIRIGPRVKLPNNIKYPAVLKPIDGAGGFETFLLDGSDSSGFDGPSGEAILQPYISGEPLSASFLVDGDGVAHKIGIGAQRIVIRERRFEYLGGEIPASRSVDEGPIRAAIAAIPGLHGFVGVDFIADRQTGTTTVIEINPRPTTSCIGLCRLLPAGHLARAWLASCGGPSFDRPEIFGRLADEIENRSPVSFAADGTILPNRVEAL